MKINCCDPMGPLEKRCAKCTGEGSKSALIDGLSGDARHLISAMLDVMQADPHQWSTRPCQTCAAVSAMAGRPFGCVKVAREQAR
jgi:hypothetical protein